MLKTQSAYTRNIKLKRYCPVSYFTCIIKDQVKANRKKRRERITYRILEGKCKYSTMRKYDKDVVLKYIFFINLFNYTFTHDHKKGKGHE